MSPTLKRWVFCAAVLLLAMAPRLALAQPRIETKPYIDELLQAQWRTQKLTPAGKTDDLQFMRRVYLDITGRIPQPWEVRLFEADPSLDKRARLVDRLLESDEYAQHWADQWTSWLLNGPGATPADRASFRTWLQDQLARDVSIKQLAEKLLTARGKPEDNPATLFLLTSLGPEVPAQRQAAEGRFTAEPATWRTVRAFLGYRIDCVRCHDHPYVPEWRQTHFWGTNLFFRQLDRTEAGELIDNAKLNPGRNVFFPRRNGVQVPQQITFLDGRPYGANEVRTRRQVLAGYIVTHPNFAPALVNRYWGQFFGRSLTLRPTVDDFGEHNEVLHPALLQRLAADFTAARHDVKPLIRWLCNSEAYQRQSTFNASNLRQDQDVFFSRMPFKELSPAQRIDALLVALRGNDTLTPAQQQQLRRLWRETLERPEVSDELDYDMCVHHQTVPVFFEAALLMNYDRTIQAALVHPAGTVARARQAGQSARILDELYLSALSRHPTAREVAWIEKELVRVAPDDVAGFWQDVFFALLNSSEFIFNH